MTWKWEYDFSEEHVIGGAPPAFVAEVEKVYLIVPRSQCVYVRQVTYL